MAPLPPDTVRALRALLRENTKTFGARFPVSGRTVEDWEQGRRTPQGPTLKALHKLLARVTKTAPTYD